MNRPNPRDRPGGRAAVWTAALLAAFAAISVLKITDAINATTGYILFAFTMLLTIPLARASAARQQARGLGSPALARYNRRFLIGGFAYVLALGVALAIHRNAQPGPFATFIIALLPALPIFGMIWTMARYAVEEEDEFLRHRAVSASLFGLGGVLAFGTFWGFLETFGVVRHIWSWWVFPGWAIGMGIAQCWMAFRDRSEGEE